MLIILQPFLRVRWNHDIQRSVVKSLKISRIRKQSNFFTSFCSSCPQINSPVSLKQQYSSNNNDNYGTIRTDDNKYSTCHDDYQGQSISKQEKIGVSKVVLNNKHSLSIVVRK